MRACPGVPQCSIRMDLHLMSQKSKPISRGSAGRGFRAGLMGAPLETGNRGVLALGSSLVRLVFQARPDAAISLLIPSRKSGRTEVRSGGAWKAVDIINYRQS